MEDVGPQYVLQPQPKPKYFFASADWQLYYTNNAALASGNKVGTDVNVFSLSAEIHTLETAWWNKSTAQAHAGIRYQTYWYGVFSDRNAIASGAPVKNSDFETISPYVEATFKRDDWSGAVGLRYADFSNNNATSSGTFYQEWVPYWSIAKQFVLNAKSILQLQYDGDYRATNTPSGGLLPTGWNNRADNSFTVVYSYIINDHLVLQPSYRFSVASYDATGRQRRDNYNTFSFVAAYYFNEWTSVRAYTSWEQRNSTEVGNNYQNWNIGLGATYQMKF
jgi:hypothetical protein